MLIIELRPSSYALQVTPFESYAPHDLIIDVVIISYAPGRYLKGISKKNPRVMPMGRNLEEKRGIFY